MTTTGDFDQVIEQYHQALGEFMKGNAEPAQQMYSRQEDVTLGNPFGPFARGRQRVLETAGRAATNYQDGEAVGFETVAKYLTPDLAYVVEVERLRSKVGGLSGTWISCTASHKHFSTGRRHVEARASPRGPDNLDSVTRLRRSDASD